MSKIDERGGQRKQARRNARARACPPGLPSHPCSTQTDTGTRRQNGRPCGLRKAVQCECQLSNYGGKRKLFYLEVAPTSRGGSNGEPLFPETSFARLPPLPVWQHVKICNEQSLQLRQPRMGYTGWRTERDPRFPTPASGYTARMALIGFGVSKSPRHLARRCKFYVPKFPYQRTSVSNALSANSPHCPILQRVDLLIPISNLLRRCYTTGSLEKCFYTNLRPIVWR